MGNWFSVTVTVAVAGAQGAVAVTVYTYAPGSIVAGSYIPPTTVLGPDHVPPTPGVPPKLFTKAIGALVLHKVMLPLVPATGAVVSVTVTVAVAVTHGNTPLRV